MVENGRIGGVVVGISVAYWKGSENSTCRRRLCTVCGSGGGAD